MFEKGQEIKNLQSSRGHYDNIFDELEVKNKKLKSISEDKQKLIKGSQQLRNQLSELEEKNKLLLRDKRRLQEQRQQFNEDREKKDKELSQLKDENKELKTKFLQNENIQSYKTIVKEALILQTFLNSDNRREIQILHDFPELSEETIRRYLSHLCDIELLSQVDDDTYKCDFSMKKDDHLLDKILYKIFECDLQKFKNLLQ